MKNRYFIINVQNSNMVKIYDLVVGDESIQRLSLDEKKMSVKLPLGDTSNHGVLQNSIEQTQEENVAMMQLSEWTLSDPTTF